MLIISEAATKLRGQVDALETTIDWDAIRGMGNFIRHNYDGIDEDILYAVLDHELASLKAACQRLLIGFAAE